MLEIKNLNIIIEKDKQKIYPVQEVSFQIQEGQIVAIIGESGCGKSQTAMAINQLNRKNGFLHSGMITYKDIANIIELNEKQLNKIRGSEIAYIDQEPMEALNPSLRVGYQIREVLLQHDTCKKKEAKNRVEAYLKRVGIRDVRRVYRSFPHQLSGGMQQRAAIAMALIGRPSLVIADEPTTALDVEMERKILALLMDLQKELNMAILIISHDLSIVETFADQIIVMYGGEVIEVYDNAKDQYAHPYTKALRNCMPTIESKGERLPVIEGGVFDLSEQVNYCHFSGRCQQKMPICEQRHPEMVTLSEHHQVRCFLYE